MGGASADPTAIIAPMRGLHLTADLRGCAAAREETAVVSGIESLVGSAPENASGARGN